MHRSVLLVVALTACGKSKAECRTEAEAFGKLLAAADTSGSLIHVSDRMKLVERSDLTAQPKHAPVVNITATEITYQGALVGGADDLVERLVATRAKLLEDLELERWSREPPDPRSLMFVIDAATPWATVVGAVDAAAKAGMTAPQFVFAAPVTWKSPPRAPIDDELDKIVTGDPAERATSLAQTTSRQVKRCASVTKLFGQVVSEGEDKAQFFVQGLPAALIECNCDLDLPNFRATMWRILVNPHPVRVIVFDPDASVTPIAAPGTKLWREVSAEFAPGVRNAKLVVD